jgi:hypothetical protein
MDEYSDPTRIATVEQFKAALLAVRDTTGISPNDLALLRAHCRAPSHTISTTQLAQELGYPDRGIVHLLYGKLAHQAADALRHRPGPFSSGDPQAGEPWAASGAPSGDGRWRSALLVRLLRFLLSFFQKQCYAQLRISLQKLFVRLQEEIYLRCEFFYLRNKVRYLQFLVWLHFYVVRSFLLWWRAWMIAGMLNSLKRSDPGLDAKPGTPSSGDANPTDRNL